MERYIENGLNLAWGVIIFLIRFIEWFIPCICERENIYYLHDYSHFKPIEYEYIIKEKNSGFYKYLF